MTEVVFIEIPGGSRNKYEFDPELGGIVLEIEHFFQRYKELEDTRTDVGGFGDRDEALAVIADARARARRPSRVDGSAS